MLDYLETLGLVKEPDQVEDFHQGELLDGFLVTITVQVGYRLVSVLPQDPRI